MSSKWSLSSRSPHKNPLHIYLLIHTCHVTSPSHSFWLSNKIEEQCRPWSFPLCNISPVCSYFLPLSLDISVSLCSRTTSVYVLPLKSKTKFHTRLKRKAQLYCLIFLFFFLLKLLEEKYSRRNANWYLWIPSALWSFMYSILIRFLFMFHKMQLESSGLLGV
jgi:hypothetical protein